MRIFIDPFDPNSVDDAIAKVEEYADSLERKADELCRKLASMGYIISSMQFGTALYDGTNDVSIELNEEDGKLVILASGYAVLFIEFGTGVHNPEHPMQNQMPGIVGHGQYGHGLGRLESWRYPASNGAGTGGTPDPNHPGYYITHGNPANMAMYNTAKDMRAEILRIAREVFQT